MPKEPIRQFVRTFTNLTAGQMLEFERILKDLEDQTELTSLSTSLELIRRKPNQNMPIPQLIVLPTVRGAVIEWTHLKDQRINFYEVDVASVSNFASFITAQTFSNSITIDGLTETKFIRVRGIRSDGTTGPYSEVSALEPELYEIRAHSFQDFYTVIDTLNPFSFGGDGTDMEYTPINPEGHSMVWGQAYVQANPNIGLIGNGSITMKLMVKTTDEDGRLIEDKEFWHMTCSEFFGTYAFGPVAVPHPELNSTLSIRMDFRDLAPGAPNASEVHWVHLNALELGHDAPQDD